MPAHFATVGHSNRSLEQFLTILREARIDMVVDVRSFPRSRSNPAFNIDQLPEDLEHVQIAYRHLPALGGRRPKQPAVDSHLNDLWRVQSFHNYADYALSDEFQAAFDELLELGRDRRVAMMCSEAVWWRCHRRIITDYLIANGHAVDHLMGNGRIEPARMTKGARPTPEHSVVYPAPPS
ncbi:DUF488 family protein [Pseudohoeflea coraliihabitans]|uniref:DUF488 domain-containing protein n=1 Tax=Pseudohoeflea coraliihabitans TaxID=2860393 RepID=A0ABS6WRQ4_9HYPH|nr:DUF488 domain-containing protein [Pseudohoeflea sp. DP4N28-3]MBW3098328.1 DUF488 domain-containing protein [Pseudohoeflea sp. DP4N28-3]